LHFTAGRIEVHSPQKLESDVLKKYFRHSKFASFQRQLNYFGFRKLAGKGKMAPCSYVNDAAMDDISSLFQIKVSDLDCYQLLGVLFCDYG
jgi:HSF-type DNA-binding